MFSIQDLINVFKGNNMFAWQVLHAQITLQFTAQLHTSSLIHLIEIYSQGMDKLNSLQHTPNNYFQHKIQQLMADKKVIHCLHAEKATTQRSGQNQRKGQTVKLAVVDHQLQARKRDLQLRLAYDMQETKNNKLNRILMEESAKEEKLKIIITNCFEEEEEKLKRKIAERQFRIQSAKKIEKEGSCKTVEKEGSYNKIIKLANSIDKQNNSQQNKQLNRSGNKQNLRLKSVAIKQQQSNYPIRQLNFSTN